MHDVPLVLSEAITTPPSDTLRVSSDARPRPLHFAHANGFPVATYRSFLAPLAAEFEIHATDFLGHHPDYPVTNNWFALCDQLIADVEQTVRKRNRPVLGVGHSLGGGLMFMASLQRPELFEQVVILDVPLITRWEAAAFAVLKRTPWLDRYTPAGRAVRRREHWPCQQSAFAYLRDKPLFRRFTDTALQDYVHAVTEPVSNEARNIEAFNNEPAAGYRLRYRPEVEAEIFRTYPTNWARQYTRRHPNLTAVIGLESDLIKPHHVKLMQHTLGMDVLHTPGGHLFPMEFPDAAAQLILTQAAPAQKGGV